MTGGHGRCVSEVLKEKNERKNYRVDLESLRMRIPEMRDPLIKPVVSMIETMQDAMSNDQIRSTLLARKIPVDLVDKAMSMAAKPMGGW